MSIIEPFSKQTETRNQSNKLVICIKNSKLEEQINAFSPFTITSQKTKKREKGMF